MTRMDSQGNQDQQVRGIQVLPRRPACRGNDGRVHVVTSLAMSL